MGSDASFTGGEANQIVGCEVDLGEILTGKFTVVDYEAGVLGTAGIVESMSVKMSVGMGYVEGGAECIFTDCT